MINLLVVLGTRPEAIKLAPLLLALRARPEVCCRLCVTGQHRELLAPVLDLFGLRPDWSLDVMRPDQTLGYLTSAALARLDGVLSEFEPDRVVVQGDTTTTLAAALAAFYRRTPVAHVEAGLRSGDVWAPWPEELNRRAVGILAGLHFAPTNRARANLMREGVDDRHIFVTGNTGIDALYWVADRLGSDPALRARGEALLAGFLRDRRLILVTGHRRESFDGGLERVANVLAQITRRPDVCVIFPVHPNPNVQRAVGMLRAFPDRVRLVEPVDYATLVYLLQRCHFVVTDSGGIQEEAPSFGKPVLVTRATTERPEAMELGLARLVGTDETRLAAAMCDLLDRPEIYAVMSRAANPYGDGQASPRIVRRLLEAENADLRCQ